MILFSETKLAQDLRIGAVTEKEQLCYLLLISLFLAVWTNNTFIHILYAPENNLFDYLSDVVDFVATGIIVFYSSLVNTKGNNRDFIARYVCLSVPIGIKGMILALSSGIIIVIVEASHGSVENKGGSLPELIAVLIVEIFLLWRYHVAFKIASGQIIK